MQTRDNTAPAEVSTVAVRLPTFWAEQPAVWFAQAEEQVTLAGISSEQTKFHYVISQLEHQYASEVEDIIISPPQRDPYTILKTELVKWLSPLKEECIHQLLTLEMGDSKPSQFLRHLRSLALDAPDDFLRSIWSSQLPSNVRAILAGQTKRDLYAAAHCADRIIEATPLPTIANIMPLSVDDTLVQHIEDLSRQVAALSAELAHLRSRSRAHLRSNSRDPCSCTRNRRAKDHHPKMTLNPPSAGTIATTELGHKSVRSPAPTANKKNKNSRCQQQHMSALQPQTVSSSRTGLVNANSWSTWVQTSPYTLTGSSRDNYDFSVANGTTIPTYGWLPHSLNLGLSRNFTWRFVVADVTHPLIGVDFLSQFGLLVDCKHNRLVGQHSRFLRVSRGA
jgi:hypothetical protein